MPMSEPDRRRLLLAVAASALIHAGLLTTTVMVSRVKLDVASQAVQAVIKVADREIVVGGTLPAAAAARMAPSVAPPPPPSTRRVRAPTDMREAVSGVAAGAPSTPGSPERSLASESATTPAPAPAPAAAAETRRAGVNADDLRQYRMALAIAARRFKHYPPLARERGWQGRVEVVVSVSAWQRAPAVLLIRSSGHVALDEQALAMLEQAAASTLLPESLQGRDLRVLLPIEFSLDDAP
ncbi:MAG: TonB family protein [Candidatus Accumulibacter sp.]|uniref:TonB family protein n=1 Tax=Candidatus Accumulibacter affinis TaxID=2954384 RepID=A0A935TEB3_9PROT|nr:TonB family protein [Candidatus Accumulibacter affinis]